MEISLQCHLLRFGGTFNDGFPIFSLHLSGDAEMQQLTLQ